MYLAVLVLEPQLPWQKLHGCMFGGHFSPKHLAVELHSSLLRDFCSVMSVVPSSAVTLAGAEQAVRAGIAAAEKSGKRR